MKAIGMGIVPRGGWVLGWGGTVVEEVGPLPRRTVLDTEWSFLGVWVRANLISYFRVKLVKHIYFRGISCMPSSSVYKLTDVCPEPGGPIFNSNFDSGNASYIECGSQPNTYDIWIAPDCEGTEHVTPFHSWFYFSVKGCKKGQKLTFCIRNMAKHVRNLVDSSILHCYICKQEPL